jgi:hypothetical protein
LHSVLFFKIASVPAPVCEARVCNHGSGNHGEGIGGRHRRVR